MVIFLKKDSFIANALLSIALYKKNNQLTNLDKHHYDEIFKSLFSEPVNILNEVTQQIPKSLVYIPNDHYKR